MKKTRTVFVAIALLASAVHVSAAEKVALEASDSVRALIERQTGKPVSLRLDNGEELKGTLGKLHGSVVHLVRLNGREYEDAFIDAARVSAVIVRVRDKL